MEGYVCKKKIATQEAEWINLKRSLEKEDIILQTNKC